MTRSTALTLLLSLVTGQRIGEIAGMAIDELDMDQIDPIWVVPGERTKHGKPNRVPLSRLAVSLIEEAKGLAGESKWLFPSARGDGPIKPLKPLASLPCVREVLGGADFRVHDLRRTAATRIAEIGVKPSTIALTLNYVSAREGAVTSERYVQEQEKRDVLDKWGALLERIITGKQGTSCNGSATGEALSVPPQAGTLIVS